jgi:hypothetical protein
MNTQYNKIIESTVEEYLSSTTKEEKLRLFLRLQRLMTYDIHDVDIDSITPDKISGEVNVRTNSP